MDSSNTWSIQSSSSDFEEHDESTTSLSNYLDAFSQSPPPPCQYFQPNIDAFPAQGLPSRTNCTDVFGLMGPLESSKQLISDRNGFICGPYRSPSMEPPMGSDRMDGITNSKKRSKASRRAPITVLTTDTSNFQAMVQEFTGIPLPPLSASPYFLRPFSQNVQVPPFPNSSSFMVDVTPSDDINGIEKIAPRHVASSSTNTASTTHFNEYQLPSHDLGLYRHDQNLLHLKNPKSAFESFLQSPLVEYPTSNLPDLMVKSPEQLMISSTGSNSGCKMGASDELSMSYGHVIARSTNPNLVDMAGMPLRSDSVSRWGDGAGSNGEDRCQLRSFIDDYGNS